MKINIEIETDSFFISAVYLERALTELLLGVPDEDGVIFNASEQETELIKKMNISVALGDSKRFSLKQDQQKWIDSKFIQSQDAVKLAAEIMRRQEERG